MRDLKYHFDFRKRAVYEALGDLGAPVDAAMKNALHNAGEAPADQAVAGQEPP